MSWSGGWCETVSFTSWSATRDGWASLSATWWWWWVSCGDRGFRLGSEPFRLSGDVQSSHHGMERVTGKLSSFMIGMLIKILFTAYPWVSTVYHWFARSFWWETAPTEFLLMAAYLICTQSKNYMCVLNCLFVCSHVCLPLVIYELLPVMVKTAFIFHPNAIGACWTKWISVDWVRSILRETPDAYP